MTKRRSTHYIKEILALKDEQGNNPFDTVSLVRKPQGRRGQRYAISVRNVKSGQTLRLSTKHEVALFLKKWKRERHTPLPSRRK